MERIATGIVRKAHGLHGEIRVESLSGQTEHFTAFREVRLVRGSRYEDFRVSSARSGGKTAYLKLEGIESAEQAALYRGWEVWIPREQAAAREPDEYYIADLCGCTVRLDGKSVGLVESVWESGASSMLEIRSESGELFNVPFMEPYIGEVDIEAGFIELLTGWILD